MSSVLTYDVVGDLHHVAYDVACDVSFDSNSGVQMAWTGPEYSALHLQVMKISEVKRQGLAGLSRRLGMTRR